MDEKIVTAGYMRVLLLQEIRKYYDRNPNYARILSEIYKNLGD